MRDETTTAPTYNIATVSDFFAVPEDRIDACLKDFAKFLKSSPHFALLMNHISSAMHGQEVVAFTVADRFQWIDDDADTTSFRVIMPDGSDTDLMTLTPDEAEAISRNLEAIAADPAVPRTTP